MYWRQPGARAEAFLWAPAPAKKSGSDRLRLHKAAYYNANLTTVSILPLQLQSYYSFDLTISHIEGTVRNRYNR